MNISRGVTSKITCPGIRRFENIPEIAGAAPGSGTGVARSRHRSENISTDFIEREREGNIYHIVYVV